MSTWEEVKRRLHAENPRLRDEYDKLGPRFEAIGALVRAREQQGITQSELARRMGVRPHAISRIESALHSPRLDTLAAYANALGLELKVGVRRSAPVQQSGARRRAGSSRVA